MTIERVQGLSQEEFSKRYVEKNRPVIVTDALTDWKLAERWTPEYLAQKFGKKLVQVYADYFDLKTVCTLSKYLKDYFGKDTVPLQGKAVPYVRWYTKLRDVEFWWSDDVFAELAPNWGMPYFVPTTDYILPFAPAPKTVDPTVDYFPAKGLFISARGARTRLHIDPWASDAILCQLYGTKKWTAYSPDQVAYLKSGSEVVDPDNPDRQKFPDFDRAAPTYEFTLGPGETVFMPCGWYHHVVTETDSVSLTWSQVPGSGAEAFLGWLNQQNSEVDEGVVQFFLGSALGEDKSKAAIQELVNRHFKTR